MRNETVLITGASRGIGRAIALRLAQAGFDIVAHYHQNLAMAQSVVEQIQQLGRSARLLQFDIANRDQCKQVLLQDIETHGVYYGVVANAGIARDGVFPGMSGDDWDSVIHTNLDSFYNVLQPLVMPMIQTRLPGRIVTMASVSGLVGNRGQTSYSAAKAGIIAATKALAMELAKRQITVNCVAPGLIETDMVSTELASEAIKHIPMQKIGKAEDVAAAVNFLLSKEASYITRQVISVNGGLV